MEVPQQRRVAVAQVEARRPDRQTPHELERAIERQRRSENACGADVHQKSS